MRRQWSGLCCADVELPELLAQARSELGVACDGVVVRRAPHYALPLCVVWLGGKVGHGRGVRICGAPDASQWMSV